MADTDTTTKDQVKEITDRLEAGMKDLFTSEKYLSYLQTMSRFHRYSTRNTLLIHMQMPNATRVGGFGMWKEKFGRNVVKGEKGIRIFAPVMHTVKKEMNKLDPDTKAPLLDEYGEPITEEREVTIPRYKVVSVFDVQQTQGKPLPQLVEDLTGDVSQYEIFLDTLREISPLPIIFEELEPSTDGLCRYGNNIAIRNGMSEIQTVCAVIHEITHALLHDIQRDENGIHATPKDVKIQELESESVSYAVCQYYNIETSPNSLGYLASWCGDKEMSELKASLDTIRKTSATLIDKIDAKFKEIAKERGQRETVPVASANYRALIKLAPDVLDGTYDYMEYRVGITTAPLSFAEVADGRYSLANITFYNGEIIRSPDMEIEADSVNHTATAVSLTLNGDPVAENDSERLNNFLFQWLANIEIQGYNKTRTYSFNYGESRTDIYISTLQVSRSLLVAGIWVTA